MRLQTWFPLQIQAYLSGHEWLARKLSAHGGRYTKHDNVFLCIEDMHRAQTSPDRFASLNWPAILSGYAKRVNPVMKALLPHSQYYWVTTRKANTPPMCCSSVARSCASCIRN